MAFPDFDVQRARRQRYVSSNGLGFPPDIGEVGRITIPT